MLDNLVKNKRYFVYKYIIEFMELYDKENIDKGFSKDKIWFDENFNEMDDLQKILKNRNYQVTDEGIFDKELEILRKNLNKEDNDTEEEASLEEEFAAYLNESNQEANINNDFSINQTIQEDEGSFEDISEEIIKNED